MQASPIIAAVEAALGATVHRLEPLGGSFAGRLYRVYSAAGDFALKWADRPAPGALAAEARGLALLASAGAVRVPRVRAVADGSLATQPPLPLVAGAVESLPARGHVPHHAPEEFPLSRMRERGPGDEGQAAPSHSRISRPPPLSGAEDARRARPAFLLIEWLESGGARPDMAALGEGLAALHRQSADAYGLDHDNFIGGTPQDNRPLADWPAFFRERRLLPQIALAGAGGLLPEPRRRALERVLGRIDDLLAGVPRRPALIHGDLWGGNVLAADPGGTPALIDPAVHYADREAEIAFTELFGGFSPRFYAAYQAAWPLAPGYAERRDLYNLYHLLNHLNLFGESYGAQVDAVARRYG